MGNLQLDTLEAKGLIRLAAFDPELEYLFRHALVQDTAYESLLKQERKELHRLVGDALEELYPDRRGDLAAVLAMHFEQAGDSVRAIRYLMDAAKFAYDRNAIVEAHELFSRADALLPARSDEEDPDTRRRRIEIQLGRAKAGFAFLTEDQGLQILEPVLPDAERLADLRLTADVHLTIALLRQFKGERPETSENLKKSLDRVSEIAAELGDPLIAALPQSIIGLAQVFTGSLREGVQKLEDAAPQLEAKHDFIGSSFALVALAIGYARLGDFQKGEDAAKRAARIAESGDLIARLDSLIGLSTVHSLRGDLEAAVPLAMQCTNLSEETGATACMVASNFVLGDAYMRQGQFQAAKIAFDRGSQVATAVEQRVFGPSIAAYIRSNAASLGDFGPGAKTFEEALEVTRAIGDRWGEANVIWKRGETAAKMDVAEQDTHQMLADFALAAEMFEDMGGRPFVARVLHEWGDALRALGRAEERDAKYRRALALFEEMGIEREAAEVKQKLAAAA